MFKQDDDDDVQGAAGGEDIQGAESGNEEFFYTSDVWSPEDRERDLIRKNIQTDKVLDLIANTTPTVTQQAQTPIVTQQADMHNLTTTAERKPTKRYAPSTYNQQKTKKKRTRMGVKKEKSAKLGKQKVKKKMKYKLWHH